MSTFNIDPWTLAVLQNFQSINPSIGFNPGSTISTMSTTESIIGKATVPITFDCSFGIYDLSKFLGILSIDKRNEIEVTDNYLLIRQGEHQVSTTKYRLCSPSLLVTPPEQDIDVEYEHSFVLVKDALTRVIKAMQILGFGEHGRLVFIGENGLIKVGVVNYKDKEADQYMIEIGKTDKTFSYMIDGDKLKLMPFGYTVNLAPAGVVHLVGENIQYWIAMNTETA